MRWVHRTYHQLNKAFFFFVSLHLTSQNWKIIEYSALGNHAEFIWSKGILKSEVSCAKFPTNTYIEKASF